MPDSRVWVPATRNKSIALRGAICPRIRFFACALANSYCVSSTSPAFNSPTGTAIPSLSPSIIAAKPSGLSLTSSTRPMSLACPPLMALPVGTSFSASPRPIRRGSLCVPPAPGTRPKMTSGKPMLASLRATR